jgi:hypothetical protein
MWSVDAKTEDILGTIRESVPIVPAPVSKIGASEVRWWEGRSREAVIMATGGSLEDRWMAEQIIKAQLEMVGYKRALFTFDAEHKTAGWDDIMEKAKRLIQSNQVTLLRNGYNNIVAHVVGDHGEYNCEIGREDPESRTITQWTCFLEDAPITMADGSRKRIDEVQPHDKVISHTGHTCDVTQQWFRPYKGQMAVIKLQGIDEIITLTANHPLWAANQDYYLQDSAEWRGRIKLGKGPVTPEVGWTEAQALVAGNYLSMAQFAEKKYCAIEGVDIDEDIATFLGWYAAEGYIVKSTNSRIGFNLHCNERPVAEMLSRIAEEKFGTPGTIRTMRWPSDPDRMEMVEFRVSNSDIRFLVESAIGVGSAEKGIHPALLSAPESIQRAFLDAYVAGDGNIDGNRTRLSTVSERMAHTLRILLTRLGHPSSLLYDDENDGNGFVKNWRRMYNVRWSISSRRNSARFMRDGHAWFKVESVDFYDYEGRVYDLEVADDHSFQAFSINCHNCECPWDQYAFQRTRKWKKYEARPCAHVMAAYWKALATPLDDYNSEEHGPIGTGQKQGEPAPPASGGMGGGGGSGSQTPAGPPLPKPGEAIPTGGSFGPDEALGTSAPMAPPGQPGILPTPPVQQLSEMAPPIPGATPGGMPANPAITSVPGAKMPSPFNPIQFPGGTYSKVSASNVLWHATTPEAWESIQREGLRPGAYLTDNIDTAQQYGEMMNEPEDEWAEPTDPTLIAVHGVQPQDLTVDPHHQREMKIGGNSWIHPGPIPPERLQHQYDYERLSKTATQEFVAPSVARLKVEGYGIAEGKSEAHGAGQYRSIPAGTVGEVLGTDSSTGWIEVIFPLKESSYLEPYHVRMFCEPGEVELSEGSTPFVQRR